VQITLSYLLREFSNLVVSYSVCKRYITARFLKGMDLILSRNLIKYKIPSKHVFKLCFLLTFSLAQSVEQCSPR